MPNIKEECRSIFFDRFFNFLDDPPQRFIGSQLCGNLFAGMQNGGMIPVSEGFPNLWQGQRCHFPAQIHCNLTGKRQVSRSF